MKKILLSIIRRVYLFYSVETSNILYQKSFCLNKKIPAHSIL